MGSRIKEIVIEPTKIHVGDTFRIKIKVDRTPALIETEDNLLLISEFGKNFEIENNLKEKKR